MTESRGSSTAVVLIVVAVVIVLLFWAGSSVVSGILELWNKLTGKTPAVTTTVPTLPGSTSPAVLVGTIVAPPSGGTVNVPLAASSYPMSVTVQNAGDALTADVLVTVRESPVLDKDETYQHLEQAAQLPTGTTTFTFNMDSHLVSDPLASLIGTPAVAQLFVGGKLLAMSAYRIT